MAIALVQSAISDPSLSVTNPSAVLGSSPTAGNLQIAWIGKREGTGSTFSLDGTGWALIRRTATTATDSWPCAMYSRTVPSGASATITATTTGAGGALLIVAEFTGVGAFDVDAFSGETTGAATVSITPAASSNVLLVSGCAVRNDTSPNLTPATGMTELHDDDINTNGPQCAVNYRIVTGTSGSYTVGSTGTTSARGVVGASFLEAAALGRTQAVIFG